MYMLLFKVSRVIPALGTGRKIKEQEVALQLAGACCKRRRKLQKSDQCSNAIRSIGVSTDGFKGMEIRVHINFTFDQCIFCSFDASNCGKVQQNLAENFNII